MTRRDWLKGMSTVAATAFAAPALHAAGPQAAARRRFPLGLQVGRPGPNADQNAAMLAEVKKIGYDMVEFAGLNGQPAALLRKQCEAAGLTIRSMHIGNDQVLAFSAPRGEGPGRAGGAPAAQPGATAAAPAAGRARGANQGPIQGAIDGAYTPQGIIQIAKIALPQARDLGCEYGVLSGAGISNFSSIDNVRRFADALNTAYTIGVGLGMKFGFHTHDIEIAPLVGGRVPLEVFMEHTDPGMRYQLDIGWAAVTGANIVAMIEKYTPRLFAFHMRDLTKDGYVTGAGEGVLDWNAIHAAASKVKDPLFYVEGGDRTRGFQNLQKYGWGREATAG